MRLWVKLKEKHSNTYNINTNKSTGKNKIHVLAKSKLHKVLPKNTAHNKKSLALFSVLLISTLVGMFLMHLKESMDPSVRALIQVPILLQTLLPKRVIQSQDSSSFPLSLDAQHTITSCHGDSTIHAPQHMAHTHQCSDDHHRYDGHINPKIIMASKDVLCLLPPRSLAPKSMPSISSAK